MWEFLSKLGAMSLFRKDDPCSKLNIPRRLHTGKKQKDPSFSRDEKIYRRFTAPGNVDDWKSSNSVSAAIFPVEDDSTNRAKYCLQAEDVLYNTREQDNGNHYTNHGILSFTAGQILNLPIKPKAPIRINGEDLDFTFHLEHKPEPCMYPHTEVWILQNGKRVDTRTPKSMRSVVRSQLLTIIEIERYPI